MNLRTLLRKYLPSPESITGNRYIGRFGKWLAHPNLWHLNRTSVAGGVAVGMFAGLIPGPLQMLGGTILAILFRVNLPVAVFTTFYTNPLTIVPLYLAAYEIGHTFVEGREGARLVPPAYSFDTGFIAWLDGLVHWALGLGKPLLVGLPILALLLAGIGYLVASWGWRLYILLAWRARQRKRKPNAGSES